MNFYENLEKYMKMKGVTAYQIAKNTSISNATLTNWKKGKTPSADKLIEIVQYLEISADELLGIKKNPNTSEIERIYEMLSAEDKQIVDIIFNKYREQESQREKSSGLKIG